MYKGIVFFDYDGTLVDESAKIYRPTEMTLKTTEQLRENGYLIMLATGRAKCYVPDTGIKFDGVIASNGAYAELNGDIIYNNTVKYEYVKELVDRADELKYTYVLENQDLCYTNGFHNKHFMDTLKFFDINERNFRPVEEIDRLRANKMFLTYESDDVFDAVSREFRGKFVLGKHRTNMSCDCDPVGNTKGCGITKIIEFAGVPAENTYAIGDGINDLDMMKNVSHGIAMGSHAKALENVCGYITGTVSDEGITNAMKYYRLI